MLLLVDNGSIYTTNLTDFFKKQSIPFEKTTSHLCKLDGLGRYDHIVLSGRRRNDQKTNVVNTCIVRHAVDNSTKLLGICYGAEIIALALGGTIKRCHSPRTGGRTVRVIKENSVCGGTLDVFESHRYEMASLPDGLVPLAESNECRYEIIRHETEPVFGTQFHPEMSPDGQNLIEQFCSL
ncbi:MAG: glutamine amidotransferase [Nitrosopumilus sp. B06]|nr:MAG: glutamine amidotransferase [Nitrosopumilus sp. B06]